MRRFKAGITNTRVDLRGERFTPGALRKLAESPLPIPVMAGFASDVEFASVDRLEVEGGELIAYGTLWGDLKGLVPVVGYIYDAQGDWMQLKAVGLVSPDQAITPGTWIKEIESEEP